MYLSLVDFLEDGLEETEELKHRDVTTDFCARNLKLEPSAAPIQLLGCVLSILIHELVDRNGFTMGSHEELDFEYMTTEAAGGEKEHCFKLKHTPSNKILLQNPIKWLESPQRSLQDAMEESAYKFVNEYLAQR